MTKSRRSGLKDWAEWLLFFSSYFPLYIIIAVQTRSEAFDFLLFTTPVYDILGYRISIVSVLFLSFSVFTFFFLYVVIFFTRRANGQPIPVREPTEKNELIITYILVHVVPFAFIDYSTTLNLLAFILLFLSLGVIQVRSSHLYVNPILAAMRYDLYEVEGEQTGAQMLLAKTNEHPMSTDGGIAAVELSNNVYITTDDGRPGETE